MTEAIFRLFEGLPRQGPGSDACTREALRRLGALPAAPRVLDLGCGSGRSALVLAEALRTKVVAVDIHQPFLDQLEAAARERGLEDLIEARCGDMRTPGVPPGSVDLLWSEGAIYLVGFAEGLRLWRPLLAQGGYVVVSECSWLTDHRAAELAAFWQEAYPAMGTIETNVGAARRAGFEVFDHFVCRPRPGGTTSTTRSRRAWRSWRRWPIRRLPRRSTRPGARSRCTAGMAAATAMSSTCCAGAADLSRDGAVGDDPAGCGVFYVWNLLGAP